jgi:hypothetical protein
VLPSKISIIFRKFRVKIILVVAILRAKNINIMIKNAYLIYLKWALFSLKFCAKIMWFWLICVLKYYIINNNTYRINSKSSIFSLKFPAKMMKVLPFLKLKKSKLKYIAHLLKIGIIFSKILS